MFKMFLTDVTTVYFNTYGALVLAVAVLEAKGIVLARHVEFDVGIPLKF